MNNDDYQQPGRPQAGGPPHNGFFVDGVVVRDPHQAQTFSALTVREGEKSYWDVICWEDGPIAGFRELHGGDMVHIEGRLGKRKNKKTNEWEISLVAEKLGVAARAVREPVQYQSPPPQQQPNWGQQHPGYQQAPAQPQQYGAGRLEAANWPQQGPQGSQGSPPPWGQR